MHGSGPPRGPARRVGKPVFAVDAPGPHGRAAAGRGRVEDNHFKRRVASVAGRGTPMSDDQRVFRQPKIRAQRPGPVSMGRTVPSRCALRYSRFRPPSSRGISPVRSLLLRVRYSRFRLPSSRGISPVRSLLSRANDVRFFKLPSSRGISPVRLLLWRVSVSRFARLPKFAREFARQVVVAEKQSREVRQAAEFARDFAGQIVVVES